MGQISNVHLKVDCFHLDSAASALYNGVAQPVTHMWLRSTETSSLGEPFDAPYNAAIAAMAGDLNKLLTAIDALGTAVSNASQAYQGVDLAIAGRTTGHGPV